MSHHLDSPIARQDIRLDITDLYVFPGEVGIVFAERGPGLFQLSNLNAFTLLLWEMVFC